MSRFLPLAAALTGLVLIACSEPEAGGLHGYAEGDFRRLAPDAPGRIVEVVVREGERVEAGQVLARFDDTAQQAALAAAEARQAAATAHFDDAAAGARAPEIAAARDQLAQARAAQGEARDNLARVRDLFEQGHVSQARLDQALAAGSTADARVAEMRQRLNLVQLPAREHQLRALQAEIAAADAQIDNARHALTQRTLIAPAAGMVHRQIRFAGEQAGPAQPVLDLLPDGAVYALVFIPEPDLAALPVGSRLGVSCDHCPAGLSVEIIHIGDEAEFTPPIIYSDAERARLVYRAEARFDGPPPPPGTPLRLEPRHDG